MRGATLDHWARDKLLRAHAIAPCPGCGYMRLNFSHRALDYAHALAEHEPYPGRSPAQCIEAVDAAYDELGDECPACDDAG